MRIAVDMHFLQDKHQGIKTVLVGLYNAVIRLKPEHEFIFIFSMKDAVSEHWSRYGETVFIGNMSRNARLAYGMSNAVRRAGGIDVSHFTTVAPFGVPGKIMLTVHDMLFMTHTEYFGFSFRVKQRLAASWSIRRADVVAVGSEYSMEVLCHLFPRYRERFKLLPNAVDVASYNDVDIGSAVSAVKQRYGLEDFILTVGRVDPRKNHVNMLNAYVEFAAQVSPDRLPAFVVVGDIDNSYEAGGRMIESLSARLPIYWLRDVDDRTLRQLYKAAMFVVMASYAEGFGLPIVEAMSAGTPVIAGDNTAMPEVLRNCGLLVDSSDTLALMNAYRVMLEDDALRTRYARCGFKRARSMDWDNRARNYLAILDEMGQGGRL